MVSSGNKRVVLGIVVIVAFLVFAFSIFPFILDLSDHSVECSELEGCPHEQQLNFLEQMIPLLISLALIVGAGTYYLMSQQIESKQVSLKKQSHILLKFLNEDEKKLVNLLMENNGKALQAEVSRLPGMSKLKSHRVVQKLMDKGVIETERIGKTNVIRFSKEVEEGLGR